MDKKLEVIEQVQLMRVIRVTQFPSNISIVALLPNAKQNGIIQESFRFLGIIFCTAHCYSHIFIALYVYIRDLAPYGYEFPLEKNNISTNPSTGTWFCSELFTLF